MIRCDSFYLFEEVAFRCMLGTHGTDPLTHVAFTKTVAERPLPGGETTILGLLVWTTEMADQGFDR